MLGGFADATSPGPANVSLSSLEAHLINNFNVGIW